MLDVGILVLFSIIFKLQCSILFNFISVNCEALHCSHLTKLHFFLPSIAKHLQNYTGDRLNFGLAAEQAKSEGYKMEVEKRILLCCVADHINFNDYVSFILQL